MSAPSLTTERPHYCGFCGAVLQKTERSYGYNIFTGQPHQDWICPNRPSPSPSQHDAWTEETNGGGDSIWSRE